MGSTASYPINFEQVAPAENWVIQHNLGYNPAVQTSIMHEGREVAILPKNIVYVSDMQLIVEWSSARSGKARLV